MGSREITANNHSTFSVVILVSTASSLLSVCVRVAGKSLYRLGQFANCIDDMHRNLTVREWSRWPAVSLTIKWHKC
jgi:hypothetical protein